MYKKLLGNKWGQQFANSRDIYKNQVYFYTLATEHADTGIKVQYHLQLLKKKRRTTLGINLTRYVQDLYAENYTAQIKKIKDLNQWGDTSWSWIEDPHIKMMSICSYMIKDLTNS